MSEAGVGNSSSSRTVKHLQTVKKLNLQIITIFGANVDTISAAHWKNHNFQFRTAEDILNENFS